MDYRSVTLFIMLLAALLIAGCSNQDNASKATEGMQTPVDQQPEPQEVEQEPAPQIGTETGEGVSDAMTNIQSGARETMMLNDTRSIYLKENPTTGYGWNATISEGLRVEEDTYIADPVSPGIVGSGGVHFWLIRAVERGNQTFDAVYARPWEPASAEDLRYLLTITVE